MTFKQWLHIHTCKLKKYKADEIVRLAVSCGFEFKEVCQGLFAWYMNLALDGCKTEFYEQWCYLRMYESEGWEFYDDGI